MHIILKGSDVQYSGLLLFSKYQIPGFLKVFSAKFQVLSYKF